MGMLKKGALILAFSAAAFTGYEAGQQNYAPPAQPTAAQTEAIKANKERVERLHQWQAKSPKQREVEFSAQNAATQQIYIMDLKKDLDAGKITQQVYDRELQQNETFIKAQRAQYFNTQYIDFYDARFSDILKEKGYEPPAVDPAPGRENMPAPGTTAPGTNAPGHRITSREIIPAVIAIATAVHEAERAALGAPIGPGASSPALQGTTEHGAIFPGGPRQNITTINGSALEAGKRYFFEGKLVINGDVPQGVMLNIRNGKVVVNGSLGENDRINVMQPENPGTVTSSSNGTHSEKYPCYTWGTGPSQDNPSPGYHYGYFNDGCERQVPNAPTQTTTGGGGLLYANDREPAVTVSGQKPASAEINTNGGRVVVQNHVPTLIPGSPIRPMTPR